MQGIQTISYDDIPDADLSIISYDLVQLQVNGIESVKQPVITKDCIHVNQQQLLSCQDAVNQIESKNRFVQCLCGKKAESIKHLRKDVRGIAQKLFHNITQFVQVIEGILTHKYSRKKIYTDTISQAPQDASLQNFVRTLYKRYHESNSISNLILKQGFQGSCYDFWAYCLLDKIKIIIPTRIIGCSHPACYELTSLLCYQKQCDLNKDDSRIIRDINDKSIIFHCSYPGCENKIDIQTLPLMLSKLFIDQELLNLLNSAPSIQFKFTYDLKNKRFKKDFQDRDPYILNIHQNLDNATYNSIMVQIQSIIQLNISQEIQEKLNQQKYQIRKINLIDPLNGKQVEFPVRCIKCTDYNRCADIRTYVAYYFKNKKKQGISEQINCPICNNILETKTGLLNNLIYFDQNIISRMFKDSTVNDPKQFDYNGKLYMLEEFLSKQKFSKNTYTSILKQRKNNDGTYVKEVEFNSLKCILNPNRKLQYPLIIKNCQKNSYIDFESFYEKMVECKFKIPEEGLQLCLCQEYCSKNPIKKYTTSLFYHEALGDALQSLKNDGLSPQKFKYNFEEEKFCLVLGNKNTTDTGIDKKIIQEGRFNAGFIDLLTDEEYMQAFRIKTVMGKEYQIKAMTQDIIKGLQSTHDASGIKIDVDTKVNQMNQTANEDLKKYQFEVTGMSVEMNNDLIKINKGEASSKFYQKQVQKDR
ncbi:unnamed protein product [Paramecium pentaurelia]|uniref:Uncharacterized protein n=1 Tax=Paramecium pentaurelia TaxID=43138 RepID=A0A8S1YND3_9CILI|nr:unnamed protein product [Paramecium pentaurelia]